MKIRKTFLLSCFVVFIISCLAFPSSLQTDCYTSSRNLIDSKFGKQELSISDSYVPYLGSGALIALTHDNLVVTLKSSPFANSIFGYEINTGEIVWSKKSTSPSFLYADDSAIYEGAYDSVLILNPLSGEILRKIVLTGVGNITSFHYQNNTLFVAGSSGRFFMYNLINDTATISEPDFTKHILLKENNIKYYLANNFYAEDIISHKIVWKADIEESVSDFVFTDNIIFVRTGHSIFSGSIYAIDRQTGSFLWKRSNDVISNIDVTNAGVYFLSVDGYFVGLDLQSGNEILKLEFSSRPFELRYTDQESIGSYFVDVNQETDRVALSLGDSCQLMVIKLFQ